MAKKVCLMCGKELGLMSSKEKCKDGVICEECFKKLKLDEDQYSVAEIKDMTFQQVKEYSQKIIDKCNLIENFKPTLSIEKMAMFDDNTQKMLLSTVSHIKYKVKHYTVFDYNQIVSFELLEDGQNVAKGGIGRALVGGALFGGVGAIVGASTRKQKQTCNAMSVKITVNGYVGPCFYFHLISNETKTNTIFYKTCLNTAQQLMSKLQLITDTQKHGEALNPSTSAADSILKYKKLLDAGAITEEEYNAKKKQLLNV